MASSPSSARDRRRSGAAIWSNHPGGPIHPGTDGTRGLEPAEPADRRSSSAGLLRADGPPPTLGGDGTVLLNGAPQAYEDLVDRPVAIAPVRRAWARHWMDWLRYAESHGSEGDPAIPHAWRYRDYLIRALNADVPYDRLVREHLAGDLLADPRINRDLRINESAIGIGPPTDGAHGYAPTDALDEQVTFTDNQIDVITKAFLGLTVSCARCHNHKFDPISQADFYALYGVMAGARPALVTVDNPEQRRDRNREEPDRLKGAIRAKLRNAGDW